MNQQMDPAAAAQFRDAIIAHHFPNRDTNLGQLNEMAQQHHVMLEWISATARSPDNQMVWQVYPRGEKQ